MTRWIVFDEATARAVPKAAGSKVEVRSPAEAAAAISQAIARPSAALVLPAADAGHALLLRIRRPARPSPAPEQRQAAPAQPEPRKASPARKEHISYQPTGFLGISDAAFLEEEEEPPPPKKWWQKLLD